MAKTLTHKALLTLTALTLAPVLAAGGAAADTVRALNWKGYGTDEPWSIKAFEEKTGHEVVHDYYNSEQEMLTKIRTNPGTYDVVVINSAYTRQAAEEGLIQPIDTASMTNAADLAPDMRNNPNLVIDGDTYGVSWVWGVTSYAINTNAFETAPNSIDELWASEHEGKVGWRDDAVEAVQLAAIATGQNINDPSDFDVIRERLRALKPQISTFWASENEWNQYMSSGEFDLATYWSGSASRSKTHFDLPVQFIIPKEGAIGWLDGLSIPADAPNKEAAKEFIDWLIDPEFYVEWSTRVGAPASANTAAIQQLPEDAFNRTVMGKAAESGNLQFMGPIEDDVREQMLELWQETKTYYQQ